MTVRLTVRRADWSAHVQATAAAYGPALVPVVKGNGYGFGRGELHHAAGVFANTVCVGSVHEVHDVPASLQPVVLTPTLRAPANTRPILTVGNQDHVAALAGWHGRVLIKLASSMHRFGTGPSGLPALQSSVSATGLQVVAYSLHLPLAGDDDARRAEIEYWLPQLPADADLWVSHLQPASFAALAAAHPHRRFRIRVGTALWHGVPRRDFLHLTADVLHTRPVSAGALVGYHHTPAPHDGTLVVIGAGSSNGIAALDEPDPTNSVGRSPFHFSRTRMPLLERPHMHASLVVVPNGAPCPKVGDQVDVQRPLISTNADELVWV